MVFQILSIIWFRENTCGRYIWSSSFYVQIDKSNANAVIRIAF
jgi:hypothetical protein